MNGQRLFLFDEHQTPVYSVCPHYKDSIQVRDLNMICVQYSSTSKDAIADN